MSEFKLTGPYYASQWNGSSLNPGTAISPYSNPVDAPSSAAVIVGSGVYIGSWSIFQTRRFIGDGKVVLDLLNNPGGPGNQNNIVNSDGGYQDVHIKNGNPLYYQSISGVTIIQFLRCVIENCSVINRSGTGGFVYFTNCIIINCPSFNGGNSTRSIMVGSILLNSTISRNLTSCALSFFDIDFIYSGTSVDLLNNCINKKINISGVNYELKFLADGSPRPDADPLIPDLASASGFSDCYTRGNFAGDPKFIDIISRIVDPDSDLLKRSGSYGLIGGVRPGKKIPVNSSDSDVTITTTDIDTSDAQNWIIQSPATEGFINIIWKLSDNISEVQRIFLDALLQFDGPEAGGSVGNNNVPDNYPASYSPLSQAGLTPNRLLFEFRTSQSIAKPTTDAQWDNDNVALGTTAGDFYLQEWNTKPTITTILGVAYGNGNPESIGGSANGINARWGHAKIRLTNNRSF